MISTISEAIEAISQFESSTSGTPWNLDRKTVAIRLKELVQNPFMINQGNLNLCGPAATFVLWCGQDPLAFSKYCIELFEQGESRIGNISVKPASDLIHQNYSTIRPRMTIECQQADWMAMSALRDSANAVLDFEGTPEEDISGISTPGEITDWLSATSCYTSVQNEGNFIINAGLEHAKSLQPDFQQDVVMLINANMLPPSKDPPYIDLFRFFPNHFIILLSTINIGDNTVEFDYWTWGAVQSKLIVDKDIFENNYYGAVIAKK